MTRDGLVAFEVIATEHICLVFLFFG